MIEFRAVHKSFAGASGGDVVALRDLHLRVETGEVHCLIGRSGCGKTTALRLVNRLELATSGEVLVDGDGVTEVDEIQLRRRLGYVIQSGGLFPHMTVAQNVGILCELEGHDRDRIEGRVRTLLGLVNLDPEQFSGRYPNALSGGQRQRVGIARALALDPAYLLMDEPFGALDPITRSQVHGELQQLIADLGKTVLLVTHDLEEAFVLGDRVSLMHDGAIVQTGSREDLVERPATEFVAQFVAGLARSSG